MARPAFPARAHPVKRRTRCAHQTVILAYYTLWIPESIRERNGNVSHSCATPAGDRTAVSVKDVYPLQSKEKKKWEPPPPPPRVGKKQRRAGQVCLSTLFRDHRAVNGVWREHLALPFLHPCILYTDLWDIIDQECLLLMSAHLCSLASEAHPPCGCLGHVHRHLAAHVHMRPANREGMAHWLGGYRSRAWVLSYLASRQMPNASFGSSSWSA